MVGLNTTDIESDFENALKAARKDIGALLREFVDKKFDIYSPEGVSRTFIGEDARTLGVRREKAYQEIDNFVADMDESLRAVPKQREHLKLDYLNNIKEELKGGIKQLPKEGGNQAVQISSPKEVFKETIDNAIIKPRMENLKSKVHEYYENAPTKANVYIDTVKGQLANLIPQAILKETPSKENLSQHVQLAEVGAGYVDKLVTNVAQQKHSVSLDGKKRELADLGLMADHFIETYRSAPRSGGDIYLYEAETDRITNKAINKVVELETEYRKIIGDTSFKPEAFRQETGAKVNQAREDVWNKYANTAMSTAQEDIMAADAAFKLSLNLVGETRSKIEKANELLKAGVAPTEKLMTDLELIPSEGGGIPLKPKDSIVQKQHGR